MVSVPVLSEQMTDVHPSVSTAGSLRIRALRLTIRCTPIASEIVTTAGSASGTAATPRAMPKMNISMNGWPRSSPRPTMMATTTSVALASVLPTRSRLSWSGVRPVSTVCSMRAMAPNSVFIPVAVTTARPRPYVAAVPA